MKILVTGGAGFIGSAVVRHIVQNTQDVVLNVDKLTYAGNLESLASVHGHERYTFSQTDICDRQTLDRLIADFSARCDYAFSCRVTCRSFHFRPCCFY